MRPRHMNSRFFAQAAGLSCSAALALAFPAQAQLHRDIHMLPQAGTIVTGAVLFDEPGQPVEPGVRVFSAPLGEFANGTNDPGFNAASGSFAQGSLAGFDILDALRKWDGSDFDAIPTERMTVTLGAQNRQTPTIADQFVAGFNFVQAGSNGGFHQHVNYFLSSPASNGVYLLKIQVRVAGFTQSEPLYVVFNQRENSVSFQAAIDYVQNVILAPAVCVGDANGDDVVNFNDITSVLANLGVTGAPGIPGDADRDGFVAFGDITFVLSSLGSVCE